MRATRAFPPSSALRAALHLRNSASQRRPRRPFVGRFDPHPKTQGFPWPRASCTRILPHRLAPTGPQDLPSQSEISPASRGTSLRLAPSVRTGADAPRAVTEIAFGLCPATTPLRGCRSVGEVVTKAPANVRPSSPRRSWDTRSALARSPAATGRSKVFLHRRICRDLSSLPTQATSFPSLGLFIPFEASSQPIGAAAVARRDNPISGSVGADTLAFAKGPTRRPDSMSVRWEGTVRWKPPRQPPWGL